MTIKELEKQKKEHYVFFYNNIYRGDDSIIDNAAVEILYDVFKHLTQYDKINLVLETGGGNLACGARLVHILKKMYKSYDVTILNRCHSTGTLIALGADNIYITPKTVISPCEPQMFLNDKVISTSIIRNYLAHKEELGLDSKDMLTLGTYYATINYFKDLCYALYNKKLADNIIEYMLEKVNSHQYPISYQELLNLGINIQYLDELTLSTLFAEENDLKKNFLDQKHDDTISSQFTLIRDNETTKAYTKVYQQKQGIHTKIFEGYKNL